MATLQDIRRADPLGPVDAEDHARDEAGRGGEAPARPGADPRARPTPQDGGAGRELVRAPLARRQASAARPARGPAQALRRGDGRRGLCGRASTRTSSGAALELLRGSAEGTACSVLVGRKARDFFRRRPLAAPRRASAGFLDRLTFRGRAGAGAELTQAYLERRGRRVWLVYNEFRSARSSGSPLERLLPDRAARRRRADGEGPARLHLRAGSGDDPRRAPAASRRGADLPRPPRVERQRARRAHDGDGGGHQERPGDDRALAIQYNKARQERITKELLDIVGGAEALRASAEG